MNSQGYEWWVMQIHIMATKARYKKVGKVNFYL